VPAVTVDDLLTLPRVPRPDAAVARPRPVRSITTAPRGFEGEGFPVRRAFHGVNLADLDPFIHLDQMGEVEYAPGEPKGTPWHPHRGFETVTYMLEGAMEHLDSEGNSGLLEPGSVQWMTAGRGIVHSEMPQRREGRLWGFQLWINLPRAQKMTAPRYQDIPGERIPNIALPEGGVARLIAGRAFGHSGPVKGVVTDPLFLDISLPAGARASIPVPRGHSAFAYVLTGHARIGQDPMRIPRSTLVTLTEGSRVGIAAAGEEELRFLLLAAEPIEEPVVRYGPFVMNTGEEIQQAVAEFRAGTLTKGA
jgi:redox-sensitive bicupin YhaK (pirin superfamily)